MSYRTGAADRIIDKLEARRSEILSEERAKKREAERNGQGTGGGLTLMTYIDAETDANNDFLYGEGWSARRASERAEDARKAKEQADAYTQWAAAHPEEARAEEEKARKERERLSKRRDRPTREKKSSLDSHAYWSGFEAAKDISIELQTGQTKTGLLS